MNRLAVTVTREASLSPVSWKRSRQRHRRFKKYGFSFFFFGTPAKWILTQLPANKPGEEGGVGLIIPGLIWIRAGLNIVIWL